MLYSYLVITNMGSFIIRLESQLQPFDTIELKDMIKTRMNCDIDAIQICSTYELDALPQITRIDSILTPQSKLI